MSGSEPKDGRRPASVLYQRDKKTKTSVLFADAFARIGIRVGGLAVIAAVFTIMFFLIYVSLPLLETGGVTATQAGKRGRASAIWTRSGKLLLYG